MSLILETKDLSKTYFRKNALNGVSLQVEQGRILGLMGPNGSGKTTLLKVLIGLLKPSAGTFSVCGETNITHIKAHSSFLADRNTLYPWMKVSDAIDFYNDFYTDFDKAKALDMLDFMKLTPDHKVKTMSKGMIEKLNLTLTFSRNAKLFLLDEPLGGVDPVARERIVSTIIKTWSEDSAIIISTHLVNDVEHIFNDVAFINEGKIVLSGDAESLRTEHGMSIDKLYIETFANI